MPAAAVFHYLSGPTHAWLQYVPGISYCWAQNRSSAQQRGQILSLNLPNTAQNAIFLLCNKSTLVIPLQLAFHKDPSWFFLPICFPAIWPSTWSASGVPPPIHRTLHACLLYTMRILSGHFFSLCRYFWKAAQLSTVKISHNLVSPENLLGYSIPFSRLLIKMWHSPGPSMSPWGITGHQVDSEPLTIALSVPWSSPFFTHLIIRFGWMLLKMCLSSATRNNFSIYSNQDCKLPQKIIPQIPKSLYSHSCDKILMTRCTEILRDSYDWQKVLW